MSLIHSLKHLKLRPHREVIPFLSAGLFAAFASRKLSGRLKTVLGAAGLGFSAFCLYFFRNPARVLPPHPHGEDLQDRYIVAAADGTITAVDQVPPPPGLGMSEEPVWRVSTFLSVLDVHINRIPVSGVVTALNYHTGKFFNATLDKSSIYNERNGICITTASGQQVGVVQIAGLIARRIVCNVAVGEPVRVGDVYGLIRFGSRTDVYLPAGVRPIVNVGQTMRGGETLLALL